MNANVRKFSSVKDQFGRFYPLRNPDGYLIPSSACDSLVVKDGKVLLITRKKEPGIGKFAMPGGHFDYGESGEQCCLRELEEECNIKGTSAKLFKVYGKPTRDARKHTISFIYEVEVESIEGLQGQDDAETAAFYEISEIIKRPDDFAFDHYLILQEYFSIKNLI